MEVHGTTTVASWFIFSLLFLADALLVGGVVAFVAWKKIQRLKLANTVNGENPKWQFADVQSILAFVIVFAFIGVVATFLYRPPTVNDLLKDALLLLIGNLSSKFGDVYAFYFNSTAQTKALTETARLTAETASKSADTMATVVAGGPMPAASPPTKQSLFDAAAKQFHSGDSTEEVFRASLRAIGYVNGEVDAAVAQYKPKKD